jgi:hypothetical protein
MGRVLSGKIPLPHIPLPTPMETVRETKQAWVGKGIRDGGDRFDRTDQVDRVEWVGWLEPGAWSIWSAVVFYRFAGRKPYSGAWMVPERVDQPTIDNRCCQRIVCPHEDGHHEHLLDARANRIRPAHRRP